MACFLFCLNWVLLVIILTTLIGPLLTSLRHIVMVCVYTSLQDVRFLNIYFTPESKKENVMLHIPYTCTHTYTHTLTDTRAHIHTRIRTAV